MKISTNYSCIDTEKEVLSSALINQVKLYQLFEYDEDIFYFENNRIIYKALLALNTDNLPIDTSTLIIKLKELNYYTKVEQSLIDIMKSYNPLDITYHLNNLYMFSKKRKLMEFLRSSYKDLSENKISPDNIIENIFNITNDSENKDDSITFSDLSMMDLDNLIETMKYLKTGIPSLDNQIEGYGSGQLIVLAGRPRKGKSSLGIHSILNMNNEILFFSHEMTYQELYIKSLANESLVDSRKIIMNKTSDEEKKKIIRVHIKNKNKNIRLFHKTKTISEIKNLILKYNKQNRCDIVFIDYLQLVKGGIGNTRDQQIGYITGILKQLALDLNMPIVIMAQLNRDVEKQNREPVSSDLRESGNIEQDADVIIFAHEDEGKTVLIISKNRRGRIGKINNLVFEKEFLRFKDLEYSENYENPEYFNN